LCEYRPVGTRRRIVSFATASASHQPPSSPAATPKFDPDQPCFPVAANNAGDARRFRAGLWELLMDNPVKMWHDEHARFGRLLDFLDTQMTAFHEGGHPNYDLMRDIVHYLKNYADRFHHPREDVAFGILAKREPALAPVIERLIQEHRVIDSAGATLYKYLSDILEDNVILRDQVETAAATYFVYYRCHLESEEAEVLPAAARLLDNNDWAAIAAAIPSGADPLFGSDVAATYRNLRAQIVSEEAMAD
jgi:hemerythrin-like domain-containing protein